MDQEMKEPSLEEGLTTSRWLYICEGSIIMTTAYLGLGSNQGQRREHLQRALYRLAEYEEIDVLEVSPVYQTEAHTLRPDQSQPPFLNAVIQIETTRTPEALLDIAQEVERREGRTRSRRRWAPRPLDIDLLAVGPEVRDSEELRLPHPRLAERRFVLRPWADLAPNFVVPPPFERSVQDLLDRCSDATAIEKTAVSLSLPRTIPPEDG